METNRRVTGIGGIFFKTQDPKALSAWYRDHLGIPVGDEGYTTFEWRTKDDPNHIASTVWALFPSDTDYLGSGSAPFMLNYRVDDLDAVLAVLRAEGVWVDDRVEDHDYGRFGWIADPDGNRIELWQPKGEEGAPDTQES